MQTYREMYPNSLTNGIGLLSYISSQPKCPWTSNIEVFNQNIERAYNVRSGFKKIIPSIEILPEEVRGEMLLDFYGQKWIKLWEDYTRTYNPLDGYTIRETGQRTKTLDTESTVEYGRTNTRTEADTGTVTDDGTDNTTSQNSIFGFNSQVAVPSNTGTDNTASTNTETRNLNRTREDEEGGQDSRTGKDEEVEEHSYTKTGNIGYTSPPDLMRRDLELWAEFLSFFEVVFSDIDKMITISVY